MHLINVNKLFVVSENAFLSYSFKTWYKRWITLNSCFQFKLQMKVSIPKLLNSLQLQLAYSCSVDLYHSILHAYINIHMYHRHKILDSYSNNMLCSLQKFRRFHNSISLFLILLDTYFDIYYFICNIFIL